jgi:hypothetical protein
MDKLVEGYDHDYPDFLQQTFYGLCDYLNMHLPNAESREADTKAHGLSVQHKGKYEDDILLSMNAEQITAYLAATNDAKKWKSKLNKQLKRSKRQQSSTTMVTLAGYCVHSTVVPAIVPKKCFAPSEEIDGKELLFSNGGGCYE